MPDLAEPTLNFGFELERPVAAQRRPAPGSDLPRATIGEDLCKARERSGKSLTDISFELKIAPHHLIAIENNSFDSLPGRAYAIGFVRSYAAFLGLNSQEFLARLKAEIAGTDVKLTVPQPPPLFASKNPLTAAVVAVEPGELVTPVVSGVTGTAPVLSPFEHSAPLDMPDGAVRQWVMAGITVCLMMYLGYAVIGSALRTSPPPVTPVPARIATEAVPPNRVAPPAPVTRVEAPARKSHEPALDPARSPAPPVAAPDPALPRSAAPALNPAGDVAPLLPQLAAVDPKPAFRAPLPLGERYGEQNRNSRVTLRVHRPTRVAVLGTRNHVFIDRVLRAGDTYRVPNMSGLKLSVPDGGAVEVILDDNTVGFAGDDGMAARGVSLQPQSIISRYRGLRN